MIKSEVDGLDVFGKGNTPSFSPSILPMSEVSSNHQTTCALTVLPYSQLSPFSMHLFLHHFAASSLKESLRKFADIEPLMSALTKAFCPKGSKNAASPLIPPFFAGLVEFPLMSISRAAQIRCGMWSRNNEGQKDQVMNYAEPPFCKIMRDLDIHMIQFGALKYSRYALN